MWLRANVFFFLIFNYFLLTLGQSPINLQQNDVLLSITPISEGLELELSKDGNLKVQATIGKNLDISTLSDCLGIDNCYSNDDVRFHVTSTENNGFRIIWSSLNLVTTFTDCYHLNKNAVQWYGGAQSTNQEYPIQNKIIQDFSYTIKESEWTAIAERYWLNSLGGYIFVDDKVPLFLDQNNIQNDAMCLTARVDDPYYGRSRVLLQYTIVAEDNPTEAHRNAVRNFLGKPSGPPDIHMISRPIWSTWVNYKADINESKVFDFAQQIVDHDFQDGQFEIDDFWESCHGSLQFGPGKFPNPAETVKSLKAMGFVVTLWVHPFVNNDCLEAVQIGTKNDLFVRDITGATYTNWWNGDNAHIVDFTNQEAREWYSQKLQKLKDDYGIDSFKFDAGEGAFCPKFPILYEDPEVNPATFTQDYVNLATTFQPFIEVRTGFRSQKHSHFVRMLDKESSWGVNNGLHSLITTLLTFNLNGYTIVLPDMVGGNAYIALPTPELFIRWIQANAFMPALQFSYLPWDFDTDEYDVTGTAHKIVTLRESFSNYIWTSIQECSENGEPVNPPIWWVDPENEDALKENAEYMLGRDVVVAPVVEEGATQRDVVLPVGIWVDGNDGTIYEGPTVLTDYPAPIDVLPWFVRNGSAVFQNVMVDKKLMPSH